MRITTATFSVISVLALTACSDSGSTTDEVTSAVQEALPTETAAEELPLKYVALGDSYASMATRDDIDQSSPFCLRSVDNYPAQLADLLETDVTDVSCQGGVAADVTNPRTTPDGELPPQMDALTEDTTLVTVTMGGNDIGFGDLASCAANPSMCSAELIEQTNAKINELPAKLEVMYDAIKQKAPNAQIITTGYLPLIADGDECAFIEPLHVDVRNWFVRATTSINDTVKQAADDAGATFVLPAEANDHTACTNGDERWTAFTSQDSTAYPMHPTAEGQAVMAEAVFAAVNNEHP